MYKAAAALLALAFCLSGCTQVPDDEDPHVPEAWKGELAILHDDGLTIYTAEDGEVTVSADSIPASPLQGLQPSEVWSGETTPHVGDFTLPEAVLLADGSLGTLSIPCIGLTVKVYETEDEIEAMSHGVAHLTETSCWYGNVGLAGHNRGVNSFFGRLHELVPGDTLTYTTAQGARSYTVTGSAIIDHMDWLPFDRTEDNRLTLLTCIDNQPEKRLIVQAAEVT